MLRSVVTFRKQDQFRCLSNAHVQRRAAWRDPCHARGVTRECVRWNGLFGSGLAMVPASPRDGLRPVQLGYALPLRTYPAAGKEDMNSYPLVR